MRRFHILWMGLLLLFAGGAAAQTWTAFSPEGGRYKIDMPAPPKVATTTVSGANGNNPMTEAVVQLRGASYVASYVDYPDRVSTVHSSDVLLDRARDGMSSGNTIRGEQKITLGRTAGREFVIVEKNGNVNAIRIYWSRNRLYTLVVTGRAGIEGQPDTRRFFDSFSIVRPSAS
ncbi:hypothetical protein BH11PSE3_BH11PSE3_32520 [soil metagenome]